MNKAKNEKGGRAIADVELKSYDEAFKRQAMEHWLRGENAGHPFGSAAARYERIEAMKDEHSPAASCAALDVSRPGYYRWKDAGPGVRAHAVLD